MKQKSCFNPFFFLFLLHNNIVNSSVFLNDEVSLLLSIKSELIDPLDKLRDWNLPNSSYHCDWTGVGCNQEGAVETLDLSNMNLTGKVTEKIQSLQSLSSLNLSCNGFASPLPKSLARLTSLKSIDLSQNFFVDGFPEGLGMATGLTILNGSGNNFSGYIPEDIGNATFLESLDLRGNFFEGSIPLSFTNLRNLKYLGLSGNNLTGEIPREIGQLSSLETIVLGYNELVGEIPKEMGNLTNLKYLDLAIGNLGGRLPRLSVLELWNNSLSGHLPGNLGHNSPLEWLDLSSNYFTGQIPPSLCNGGNLTKLILFNNGFTGPIPTGLSTCKSLVRVRAQNNFLNGTIPVGFGSIVKLQRLELAYNSLTGQIPNDISASTSLSFIDFSQNQLQSLLPFSVLSIPNLQNFLVSGNNMAGEIPDQFQDCPALSVLDLSSNQFTGKIPASIASCEKLVMLNLRDNLLTGSIPVAIAMMPALAVLDLSNNSLISNIPASFGNSPALEMLNVSYNRLEGQIPTNGMLKTINPSDLVGNAGLCGGVLPPCNHNTSYSSDHGNFPTKHAIIGWITGVSLLLSIAIAVFGAQLAYKKWYANGSCFEERFEMSKGDYPWRLMAFQRLGFTTTDILACVKESNVIGMGSTGIVYKAEIQRLNVTIAVKKLWNVKNDIELGTSDDIVGEVNLLGKLRHRNIVRLLGFLHNDKTAMIIYEYMENGSLGEVLHGKRSGGLLVDWVSRYDIAVGVAQGLAYMHHDCRPPVIHRDVKSNNILLDANLEARIADFGLAKTMVKKNVTVSMVAGSYGYIAPEYGYTLKVDERSDVYSYGVVLLELLTGKRPLEPEFGESTDIVEWIRKKVRENMPLEGALDPGIGSCGHVQEEILLVLRIAVLCTAKLPKDRPSMRDVLTMLAEAKPRRKTGAVGMAGGVTGADKDRPVFSTSPVNGFL